MSIEIMSDRKIKKSSPARVFLRDSFLVLVILLPFVGLLSFSASGKEGIWEAVKDEVEEINSNLNDLLGVSQPEPEEKFEALSVEKERKLSELIAETLQMKKVKSGGKEKYAMKSSAGDLVEFSDRDESSNEPYLKLDKWEGETNLKIKIPHAAGGAKSLNNNRIKVDSFSYDVEIYPRSPEAITEQIAGQTHSFTINDEGGVEFDVVLDSAPSSNVFEFPVEEEGLKFYYQPPLDAEHPTWSDRDGDGTADTFCPEIVVGSYAVYYESQEGMLKSDSDGEKYKTGKAFHIYRPKVTDATGNAIWGELDFDEAKKTLSVTVDAAWLAAASYPVRVDPNVGYTAVGGTASTLDAGSLISFTAVSGADGVATSVSAYMLQSVAGNSKGNIYNSAYSPLDATGTEEKAIPAAAAWVQHNYVSGPEMTPSDDYFITIWLQQESKIYYDTGASANVLSGTAAYGGAWPTLSASSSTMRYSIYATYTESRPSSPGVGISGGGMLMF